MEKIIIGLIYMHENNELVLQDSLFLNITKTHIGTGPTRVLGTLIKSIVLIAVYILSFSMTLNYKYKKPKVKCVSQIVNETINFRWQYCII